MSSAHHVVGFSSQSHRHLFSYFRPPKSITWLRPGLSLQFFCGRFLSGQDRSFLFFVRPNPSCGFGQGPLLRSSFGRTSGVISFGQDCLRSSFDPYEGVISLGQDPVQCSMSKPIAWLRPGSPFSGTPLVVDQESSPSTRTVSGPPLTLLKD